MLLLLLILTVFRPGGLLRSLLFQFVGAIEEGEHFV